AGRTGSCRGELATPKAFASRELSFESKPQTEIVRTRRRNQVAAATAILNKSLFVGGLITALNAFSVFSVESAGSSLNFAGVAFFSGFNVQGYGSLYAEEKFIAAQGGNGVPPN